MTIHIKCVLIILVYLRYLFAQVTSPCPRIFTYENNNTDYDRWYGQLVLTTDNELSGIWLRIRFDKPPIQLGVRAFILIFVNMNFFAIDKELDCKT